LVVVDVSHLAMSGSVAAVIQPLSAVYAPAQGPSIQTQTQINLNAPSYVSPAIAFDPAANVVVFTYRSAGKVTEQIPSSAALSRYQAVDDTGAPSPPLPVAAPRAKLPAANPPPSPAPPSPTTSQTAPTGLIGGPGATTPNFATIA
jgi:hypothetical protein